MRLLEQEITNVGVGVWSVESSPNPGLGLLGRALLTVAANHQSQDSERPNSQARDQRCCPAPEQPMVSRQYNLLSPPCCLPSCFLPDGPPSQRYERDRLCMRHSEVLTNSVLPGDDGGDGWQPRKGPTALIGPSGGARFVGFEVDTDAQGKKGPGQQVQDLERKVFGRSMVAQGVKGHNLYTLIANDSI